METAELKEVVRELEFGVIERRFYNSDGKLVETRKVYPARNTVPFKEVSHRVSEF